MTFRRQAYTPLKLSDFTVINQTTTTIYDGYGGIELVRAKRTVDSLILLVKTAPTPPYSITMHCQMMNDRVNLAFIGFVWKNSAANNLVTTGIWSLANNPINVTNKYSKYDTYVADYTVTNQPSWSEDWWLRIVDDSVNRICYSSRDSINWTQYHSVGRTDYITPNQVGFCFEPNATNTGCAIVDSWKVDYSG